MKMVLIAEALGADKLQHFIAVARRYCRLIEDQQLTTPEVFLPRIQQILLDLYTAALHLDWIDLQSSVDYEITKIDLPIILRTVAEKVGDNRYYWSALDPVSEIDTQVGCGDLLDDLSDIYKDLTYSLAIFDLWTVESQENAVWQFKFDFAKHWGDHCINALRAIHFFIQKVEK